MCEIDIHDRIVVHRDGHLKGRVIAISDTQPPDT
jgi:hypothetical protein